ncbi:MAG: transposase family protein [Chloroflexi bacterium]|nr:MAG: transposase family protein [Chloroflexota bacterium]
MVASRKADHLLCPLVLLASFYSLVRLMIGLVALTGMAQNEKDAEILALRHEVAVLRRRVKRPDLFPTDRAIFAALGTNLPAGRLMFQPTTLLRWHRELVRRKWAAFQRRPRRGRPRLAEETKALIREMARENPRWGDRRIKGELLKLGIKVSASAIRMFLRAHRIPPAPRRGGPTWRQFIRAHAAAIIAIDFFTIESVFLRTIYVIVFLELGSRRLLWADCTTNPDSAWVTQQARNVAYEIEDLGLPVRFAIHDRDAKFTSGFDAVLESEGVEVIRTPFRAPRANSHCERSIGSARREFFDFVIVIGERHLRLLLDLWLDHYNRGRPHMALDLVAPDPRPTAAAGAIVRERKLFGLTTEYWHAA